MKRSETGKAELSLSKMRLASFVRNLLQFVPKFGEGDRSLVHKGGIRAPLIFVQSRRTIIARLHCRIRPRTIHFKRDVVIYLFIIYFLQKSSYRDQYTCFRLCHWVSRRIKNHTEDFSRVEVTILCHRVSGSEIRLGDT